MKKVFTVVMVMALVATTMIMTERIRSDLNNRRYRQYIESGKWVETTMGEEGSCIYFFEEEGQHIITLWTPSYESDLVTLSVKGYDGNGVWTELKKVETDKDAYHVELDWTISDLFRGVL